MTRDDILRMAQEAGPLISTPFDVWCERFAELVATHQREQDAQLVKEMVKKNYDLDDFANSVRAGMMRLCSDGRPKWLKDEMEAAKIERMRLDAERYQWLKQRWTTTLLDGSIQMASSHGIRCKSFSEIDAVIDASRANYEY